MDAELKARYMQAKAAIELYRLTFGKGKEPAFLELERKMADLGFESADEVSNLEAEYERELLPYADFSPSKLGIKLYSASGVLTGMRELRLADEIPDSLFMTFPEKYVILVPTNYTMDGIDVAYCKAVGITVMPGNHDRPADRPEAYYVHGPGTMQLTGHIKAPLNYRHVQLLVSSILSELQVPDVRITSNDIEVKGQKVGGGRLIFGDGLTTLVFFLSFSLDKGVFKPAFRNVAVWDRIGSVHTACGVALASAQIKEAFWKVYRDLFGVDLEAAEWQH
jgi:hypothetical protein